MKSYRFLIHLLSIVGLLSMSLLVRAETGGIGASASVQEETLPPVSAANIELVGQLGGASYAVAARETWLYAAVGPRMLIFDASDPANPLMVGQTSVIPDMVIDIQIDDAGDYAYLAAGDSGLCVVAISDPTQPVVVGYYQPEAEFGESVSAVAVAGDYAYLAVADGSLRVVRISDPISPTLVGQYQTTGPGYSVAVTGDYAYFGAGNSLHVVNVSPPATPVWQKTLDLVSPVRGINFAGERAYVANDKAGLRIFNVSNVAAPNEIGVHDTPGSAYDVAVSGDYAYVADEKRGTRVIDVSNPAAPEEVGSYKDYDPDAPGVDYDYTYDVTVSGTTLYVAARYIGVRIVDVTTPTTPTERSRYTHIGNSQGIAVSGGHAYVADGAAGVHAISIHAPATPRWLDVIKTEGYAHNVIARGAYAYVAAGLPGMRVLDISSPSALVDVGGFNTPGRAYDLALQGQHAFIADGGAFGSVGDESVSGLIVLDVTSPISPNQIGYTFTLGTARGITLDADYAYIADSRAGLVVMDITDPAWPKNTGFYTEKTANDVAVWGNYAYITDRNTLHIIDLSTPSAPKYVTNWPTPGGTLGVSVVGNYAVVADEHRGVHVLDLSKNPENPTVIGYYDTPGITRQVTMVDRYIYVADGEGGILALWLSLEGSAIITPEGGTTDAMPDGTIYTFPPASFQEPEEVILRHVPRAPGGVPAPGALVGIDQFFEVTAFYSSTGQTASLAPGTTYTIVTPYLDESLGVAIVSTLDLYRWDGAQWTPAETPTGSGIVDETARTLTATTDRLALFGVLGETHRVYLPVIARRH